MVYGSSLSPLHYEYNTCTAVLVSYRYRYCQVQYGLIPLSIQQQKIKKSLRLNTVICIIRVQYLLYEYSIDIPWLPFHRHGCLSMTLL